MFYCDDENRPQLEDGLNEQINRLSKEKKSMLLRSPFYQLIFRVVHEPTRNC